MRLLQRNDNGSYTRTSDLSADELPSYAILSHTWGLDEVLFEDIAKAPDTWQQKFGYSKIQFCAEKAKQNGLRYFWVDTCCIDKSDSVELQTAINSMFRWYRNTKRCYFYLSDVSYISTDAPTDAFRDSKWPTRGWTLQELLAPSAVEFYSMQEIYLKNKQSLERQLCDITGIPAHALRSDHLSDFPIVEIKRWIRNRQTKYKEDMAYSLLKIFGVYMPLIYDERRQNAQKRLRKKVQKAYKGAQHTEFSVTFSLTGVPEIQNFTARESKLIEIHRVLSGSDGTRRSVVLHSLSSIGKTQLAITYTKRYRDEHSAVFWLNIKDEASIQQSFIKMVKQIMHQHADTSCLRGLDLQDIAKVIDAVKAWLSLPGNTRWLLMYDNYDDPKLGNGPDDAGVDIDLFLPEAYQGSVIITTRSSQVNIGHSIRIKKLESIKDSLQILATTSGRNGLEHSDDAKILAEELDRLPLALATAGVYLRRVAISFADYFFFYKESPEWACELADKFSFNSAIGTLYDYRFVEPNTLAPDLIGSRGYSIYSCVHSWTVCVLNEERDVSLFELSMKCVASNVPPKDEPQYWLRGRRPLPHALRCAATISDGMYHNMGWVFRDLGLLFRCQSRLQDSEDMYLRALRAFRKAKELRLAHESSLRSLFDLGVIYFDQGKMRDAEDMFLQAFRGCEEELGPDHILLPTIANNLAVLYVHQGKQQDAENMCLRALRGYEEKVGPDHISTLTIVNNLGLLYMDWGKLEDAENMSLRALRGSEKVLDLDNPYALKFQRKFQDAEDMYLRALRGYEKAMGPRDIMSHRPALNTFYHFALLRWKQGRLFEAKSWLEKGHTGFEALLGPSHQAVLKTQDLLSKLDQALEGESRSCNIYIYIYIC
ncbi:heterokaryon incompatibility protein-domain-containing protein [Hypoxylon argillaceum]|nr:heterokaryon incompatibility protein-domain-containing protein [Hypoxylon argillaceum]